MHQSRSREGMNQTVEITLLTLIIPVIALALITIGERLKNVVPDKESRPTEGPYVAAESGTHPLEHSADRGDDARRRDRFVA
jgi:hypothetical protein